MNIVVHCCSYQFHSYFKVQRMAKKILKQVSSVSESSEQGNEEIIEKTIEKALQRRHSVAEAGRRKSIKEEVC